MGPENYQKQDSADFCPEKEEEHKEEDYDEATIPANCWDESKEDYKKGGYHPVTVGEVYNDRYLILGKLGWGHFSTVWLALDASSDPLSYYALKFQKGANEYRQAAYDEIDILTRARNLSGRVDWTDSLEKHIINSEENPAFKVHGNFSGVVGFVDFFEVTGPNGVHVCMVFDVMGPNILQLISLYEYKGVPIDVVRKIAVHSLMGLDYLHRVCGVIHTDIKPENIVVSSPTIPMIDIKLINFEEDENSEKRCGGPVPLTNSGDTTERVPFVSTGNENSACFFPNQNSEKKNRSVANTTNSHYSGLNAKERRKLKKRNQKKMKQKSNNAVGNASSKINVNDDTTVTKSDNGRKDFPGKRLKTPPYVRLHLKPMPSDPINSSYYRNYSEKIEHNNKIGSDGTTTSIIRNKKESENNPGSLGCEGMSHFPLIKMPYHYHLYEAYHPDQYIARDDQRYTHLLPLTQWSKGYIGGDLDFSRSISKERRLVRLKGEDGASFKIQADDSLINSISKHVRELCNYPETFTREEAEYRIVDLGNACWIEKHFSQDIQTRQYRSPEVIIGAGYTWSADIWSLGCTIFELITGDLLFTPKSTKEFSSDDDHLAQMMELLGEFPSSFIKSGKNSRKFFNKFNKLYKIPNLQFWDLESVLIHKYCINKYEAHNMSTFLYSLLALDPKHRPEAQRLLDHPWLRLRGVSNDYLENMLAGIERPLTVVDEENISKDLQSLSLGRGDPSVDLKKMSVKQELSDWFNQFKKTLDSVGK